MSPVSGVWRPSVGQHRIGVPPDTGRGIETTDVSCTERTWEGARLPRDGHLAPRGSERPGLPRAGQPAGGPGGWGLGLAATPVVSAGKGSALVQRFSPHVTATARHVLTYDRGLRLFLSPFCFESCCFHRV